MAKRSLFHDFMSLLKKHWRAALPYVRPPREPIKGWPKASTFYAGFSPGLKQHVFLNFQHSVKAWQVGRFTINVILSPNEQLGELLRPTCYADTDAVLAQAVTDVTADVQAVLRKLGVGLAVVAADESTPT